MITSEQVPKNVAYAAEAAWANEATWQEIVAAALSAWPGMRLGKYRDVAGDNDRIILPLTPQESTNA